MSKSYYETKDLTDFPNIGEYAPKEGEKFFEYYGQATGAGALSEREKALIALTVSHTENCPYCIDAYTNTCLEKGSNKAEMTEAIHVACAIRGGAALVHGVQMRNICQKVSL